MEAAKDSVCASRWLREIAGFPMPPIFRLFLLLAVLAALLALPARGQTVVRVLQYNIHRDIGNGVGAGSVEQVALAKVVNYLAPDVWTINELATSNGSGVNFAAAHDALVAFINTNLTVFGPAPVENQNYFVYVGSRTDGFITSAIVSRWPFLATQTYSDAYSPESVPALRGLVSAQVDVPGAVELGVFTTHLKASSFSDTTDASTLNAKKREGEATADAANVGAWLAAHPGDAAVMSGDWNETEEPGETDNWKVGAIGDPIGTAMIYHPVTTLRDAGFTDPRAVSIAGKISTIDSASPTARFDYAMYRGSHLVYLSGQVFDTKQINTAGQLAALNATNGTSFVKGDSAAASDHLPVLESFLVTPGPALIAAQGASSLASTAVVLVATVNPNGSAATWHIELGTTTAYGASSISQTLSAGAVGNAVSFPAAGLVPGTVYHFRFVVQNGTGTSNGADMVFTTPALVDSDGDGLPNDWETAHGLNPNSAADAPLDGDGDGASNAAEFAAATDSRDATSALRISAVARAGDDFAVSWPSVFGKRYQLRERGNLVAGAWTVVQDNIAGTGGPLSATEAGAALLPLPRFYQIKTLP